MGEGLIVVRSWSLHRGVPSFVMAALLAVLAGWLATPSSALAQSAPTLHTPSFAVCGTSLRIEGTGFPAQEHIRVYAATTEEARQIGSATTDGIGGFTMTANPLVAGDDCGPNSSFTLAAFRASADPGVGDAALASTRITYGSPTPSSAGLGVPGAVDDATNPLLIVLALAIGVVLLRSKPWMDQPGDIED